MCVFITNDLPEETSIHWHGLPVPNGMDGVPGVTQKGVQPGEDFVYEFVADNPGKWIHHCHNLYHMMAGMANVITYQS